VTDKHLDDLVIIPERDEIDSYQNRGRRIASPEDDEKEAAPVKREAVSHPVTANIDRLKYSLLLAFLVACAGGGLAVYLKFQLDQAQLLLAQSQDRLGVLESRLSITDETMTESGTQLNVKMKEHDSEIRKLWTISNEKNKKAINDNAASIVQAESNLKKQAQSIDAVNASVKEGQTSLAATKKTVDQVNESVAQLKKIVAENNEAMSSLRESVTDIDKSDQANAQAVAKLDAALGDLDDQISGLESSLRTVKSAGVSGKKLEDIVAQNSEAIEGINQYRKQINQELLQLKQELQLLRDK